MNCEAARDAMDAQFVGEPQPETETTLRAHLPSCEACRERYERLARVDAALSKDALATPRLERLEARILGAVAPAQPASPLAPPTWLRSRAWGIALAAATVAVVFAIPLWRAQREDPFTPRGAGAEAWGVRAFCVGPDTRVTAEALAGGTLRCTAGSSVQFTYTAPRAAQLDISLSGPDQRLFPGEGAPGAIAPGVDVALPSSTPVGTWLAQPRQVTVRFTDSAGAVLSLSTLELAPQ